MSVNVNKLKGKIIERGMNISALAKDMGVDRATLYRKLSNEGETLLVKDVNRIVEVLNLSAEDAVSIFFSHLVA